MTTRKQAPPPVLELRPEEPPVSNQVGRSSLASRYADAIAAIQGVPGTWFRVLDYNTGRTTVQAKSSASGAVHSLKVKTPGFEWTCREGVVYGRYLNGQG